MADNLKIRQPLDGKKINVNEAWEVKHWSGQFKVTEAQLKLAVAKVGPMVDKVKAYLNIK